MLSWLTNPNVLLGGLLLAAIQVAAALPWLRAIDPRGFDRGARSPHAVGYAFLAFLGFAAGFAAFLGYKADSGSMVTFGRTYGAVLHLQLLADLFLLGPQLLVLVWPKGGAVALAAYREGWRQPMFWLIVGAAKVLIWVAVVTPYFTFGDDYKMMKQIGFDIVMLAAALFGILAASMSISEEIEGRTAITLMSKPVNRRQFLIGKFLGILMACGGMSLLIGLTLNAALLANPEFDKINEVVDPMSLQAKERVVPAVVKAFPVGPARAVADGAGRWLGETVANTVGIGLGFGQVMILTAVATALATRLPFVVNLVICLVVYLLGHLAPVIVAVTNRGGGNQGAAVSLVRFLGNLFDLLLPALEFFNMGPAIIREVPLDFGKFVLYVATVSGYAVLYTVIALVVGLLLFEDRDLA